MAYSFTDPKKASEAGRKSRRGRAKRSDEWEALKGAILNKHTARFNEILDKLEPEVFVKTYLEILKYFRPRLQSVTVEALPTSPPALPYKYGELESMSIEDLETEIQSLKQLKDDNQETSPTKGNIEA